MKLAMKLAFKNIVGAGLRTWLNVGVLAFVFIVIIFYNAFLNGWQEQARLAGIAWEYGNGHLQNENYNPYNSFTIQDGHSVLPKNELKGLEPILVRNGTIYPEGRMVPLLIKGIDINQNTLKLPTKLLANNTSNTNALIGIRMAEASNLKVGDEILVRWRDQNGTYDATNITISGIFNTTLANIDNGQIWISIDKLREMTGLSNHASYFVAKENYKAHNVKGWNFISQKQLLKSIDQAVGMERASSVIIYLVLLAVALLAVFDTQVLSIFRRQKEIGTFIALGMTRKRVTQLFTVEGSMYALLATIVGGLIGTPLFIYTATKGISLFDNMSDVGIPMAETIYPLYSIYLVVGTFLLIIISATIVSLMPARKISRMNPVEALKGKIQ